MLASYLEASAAVLHEAAKSIGEAAMSSALTLSVNALKSGKPILACGNGGSAADATKPGPWVSWQETTTAPVDGKDQISR